jgi:hypothetical protein
MMGMTRETRGLLIIAVLWGVWGLETWLHSS